MALHESGENYLETILILQKKTGSVRAIDISRELGFSKPSVSKALGLLKSNEYICIDSSMYISLTQKGQKKAEDVYDRHNTIAQFLIKSLGVSEHDAFLDACKIEHILSPNVFEKMKSYLKS